MKKIMFFAIALVAVSFGFISCKDDDSTVSPSSKEKVAAVEGSYFEQQSQNITLRSAPAVPVGISRTWTMYRKNLLPVGWELVDGTECLFDSNAYRFWQEPGNNPCNFTMQQIYSNLTPVEDLRLVCETKNADGVAYLGMTDFHPDRVSFPLGVNTYRLGDELQVNDDAITELPGYSISIAVSSKVGYINSTKTSLVSAATSATAWPSVFVYDNQNDLNAPAPSAVETFAVPNVHGDALVFSSQSKKLIGTITIAITIDGRTINKEVQAPGIGHGLLVKITTTKVGWYDSSFPINVLEKNIDIETVEVPVN